MFIEYSKQTIVCHEINSAPMKMENTKKKRPTLLVGPAQLNIINLNVSAVEGGLEPPRSG